MSRSNKFTGMCFLLYTINMPNIKMISPKVIEISLERTNFEFLQLGKLKYLGIMVSDYLSWNPTK